MLILLHLVRLPVPAICATILVSLVGEEEEKAEEEAKRTEVARQVELRGIWGPLAVQDAIGTLEEAQLVHVARAERIEATFRLLDLALELQKALVTPLDLFIERLQPRIIDRQLHEIFFLLLALHSSFGLGCVHWWSSSVASQCVATLACVAFRMNFLLFLLVPFIALFALIPLRWLGGAGGCQHHPISFRRLPLSAQKLFRKNVSFY